MCLRAGCIGERAKRRVSIIMKFRKRPARRKGASPGDNDLCHLCCCEDGGRVDNLCWHQDRCSSSWHPGRRELVSEPSAAVSPVSGISLFCSGTKPTERNRRSVSKHTHTHTHTDTVTAPYLAYTLTFKQIEITLICGFDIFAAARAALVFAIKQL